MGKNSSGFRLLTVPLRRVDCGCYVAGGRRAGARIQDSGKARPRHTCRRLGQFWVSDSYCQTLCRLSHAFLRYRPFRLSTLDCLSRAENFKSVWLDFGFQIAPTLDVPPTADWLLPTAYCLLPFLESWVRQRSCESSSLSFLTQARNTTNCLHWQAAGFDNTWQPA